LIYETRKQIRKDFYEFLVSLGIRNIQIFEAELLEVDENTRHPAYLNFIVIAIIDLDKLRDLSIKDPFGNRITFCDA